MKKNKVIITLFLGSLLFYACGNAAKLTEYDFGTDKVPSVNAVIGEERKVSGVGSGTTNGIQHKQYTYKTTSMVDDLAVYTTYLRNNGWAVIESYNFNNGKGIAQLAIESADKGKILIMSIDFKEDQYEIKVEKTKGTLTSD